MCVTRRMFVFVVVIVIVAIISIIIIIISNEHNCMKQQIPISYTILYLNRRKNEVNRRINGTRSGDHYYYLYTLHMFAMAWQMTNRNASAVKAIFSLQLEHINMHTMTECKRNDDTQDSRTKNYVESSVE